MFPASAAALAPTPPTGSARLQGLFALAGRLTVADDVPGERVGDAVLRNWAFTAPCSAGPCQNTTLVRARAGGSDTVALRLGAPGYYLGSGRFYAPLRCGRRTYPNGARVPFRITVRVTSAAVVSGVLLATRIRATYVNLARQNLSPCVTAMGHDSAQYHGHLVRPT